MAALMASDRSDSFSRFAAHHRLQISTAELSIAPRDVVAPPSELGRHTLVTLSGPRADAESLQLLFVTEASDLRPVSVRDALWWLVSDSWAIEQAERDFTRWAATYQYPDGDPASLRLFQLHSEQRDALMALLGESAYQDLLRVYEVDVAAGG